MPISTVLDGERARMSEEDNTDGMSLSRWKELMDNESKQLTPEEKEKGWHFCYEFDGLLVGPADPKNEEWNCCTCFSEEEKASFLEKAKSGKP
jgi:hypothetical protein